MSDNTPFYVTTPIYYVNDKPHIGHAYTTMLADMLARSHRLLGHDTWFLTGTDEHGQKVQEAAAARGVPAQAHVDEMVLRFQELWQRLEITHDDFIRTTDPRHTKVVQEILQDLYDRGEIYQAEYDGLYDVRSETFITEKDLPDGYSLANLPDHVKVIQETNYFFRMSNYQEWLIQYIQDNPEFIQPDFRRNETLGFLRKELSDLCISRPKARLSWGIELPFDSEFVTYVWFDALVNYISAVGYKSDDAQFARRWPAQVHLIGKDILTTHTVYWPTMLKAMGVDMPKTIFAHGWWLSGRDKMSKSTGNVVNPLDYADRFGVDALRYFLIAEMNLGQDASFTEEVFIKRYNSDLANDLGNLTSRVLKMVHTHCDAKVPQGPGTLASGSEEAALWTQVQQAVEQMDQHVRGMRPDLGVAAVMTAIREANKYIGARAPWKQAKDDDKQPLYDTLYVALEALRVCSALLYPVMPAKMTALRNQIGAGDALPVVEDLRTYGRLSVGTSLPESEGLFPRHQKPKPAPEATPNENAPKADQVVTLDEIGIDDFFKAKLKTAVVREAEKVEGADKLLKLQLDVGGESRQIVAGIAQHYSPEQVVGKTIIIVSNLKPATIRGIDSRGMLLAASKGKNLTLVTVDADEFPSGAKVG
ncbi:MAG: methionine--tRNA ligase [Kiritimatiellae bacterium]|jgi:methionyl-tRNA synthetase|nr:methionine--tRNA ligase [Kiritimatiellia bacterium]